MEKTTCSRTKEELIEIYNGLEENTKKILDNSYSTVACTKAGADRLEEIKIFSKKMGFKKLGVAFCKGLRNYGEAVDKNLSEDFEVVSVCCNVCGITKEDINVEPVKYASLEPACNPLGQATVLNDENVELTIKCGFCLGHDILFSRAIDSPNTALFIKDRKNKHNTTKIFEE